MSPLARFLLAFRSSTSNVGERCCVISEIIVNLWHPLQLLVALGHFAENLPIRHWLFLAIVSSGEPSLTM
jgi:hypothetical protein